MKILIIEDELSWQDILRGYVNTAVSNLDSTEVSITVASNYEEARSALDKGGPWNLLIADITLDPIRQVIGKNYGQIIIARAHERKIPTIIVSGTISVSDAGRFLRQHEVLDCFSKEDLAAFEGTFINCIKSVLAPSRKVVEKFDRGYALLIGVGDYPVGVQKLRKTVVDAQGMHSALVENGYASGHVYLLLDQQATKAAISDALDSLATLTTVEDTLVIFFAGHGLRRVGGFSPGEYLCPVDMSFTNLEGSCISSNEFTNALRSIKAGRIAIFLDACHSGGVGETRDITANIENGLSEETYNRLATEHSVDRQGRVIIASCKANESSWELSEMANGLFTHYLLKGLRGEAARIDGQVPIMRLFEYISDKVPQHRSQHPFIKASSENFIIAKAAPL